MQLTSTSIESLQLPIAASNASRGDEGSRSCSSQATRVGAARRSLAAALGRGEGEKQRGKRRRRGSPGRAPAEPPPARHDNRPARLRPRRRPPPGGAPAAPPTELPLAKVMAARQERSEGIGSRERKGIGWEWEWEREASLIFFDLGFSPRDDIIDRNERRGGENFALSNPRSHSHTVPVVMDSAARERSEKRNHCILRLW